MIVELVLEVTQTVPVEVHVKDRQQIRRYHDYCEYDVTFARFTTPHDRYTKPREGRRVHICTHFAL